MSLPSGTVTFLLTDIEGSTRLWEAHGGAMRAALARHDALADSLITEHQGALVKSRGEGDSLFAVFSGATDALAAALTLQRAFLSEPWPEGLPLRVRMALHTGEAELREGDYYGAAVNRCARLRAAAHGGQVLLSLATEELVREALPEGASLRDLGQHRLRDLATAEHVYQLQHPDLPRGDAPLRSLQAFRHNLPVQLTSFVGREREMAEVERLLVTTHLLTLTGAGGCGKTRLSLQVAADVLDEYEDGVWLVELAPLSDPSLLPQAVAAVLGVKEEPGKPLLQSLGEYLKPKQSLLLLDNCEHLLAACAGLADAILRGCPKVRMLASSRECLGITGEQTYRVPSLSLPNEKSLPPLEQLSQFEAVKLFAERAVLGQPTFTVTQENAPAVVQVCRRLDGVPLAIELAAARVKALPVEQIAARLDDRFRLLTGGSRTALPRQQTLRAAIEWSYNLLLEPERILLRRLSVFVGGWTLEAAEAACGADPIGGGEVLDLLTSLVEKSLVLYEEQGGGEARYQLLETVRQYARDRLLESGEADTLRARHRDFFLSLAEAAEPKMRGPEQDAWLARLEAEHDNLRAALEWCRSGVAGTEAGLRLAAALFRFWHVRSLYTEGRGWLQGALERAAGLEGRQARLTRARALNALTLLFFWPGDWPNEPDTTVLRSWLGESIAITRGLAASAACAEALALLADVFAWQGDYAEARPLYEEAVALNEETGSMGDSVSPLLGLADIARVEGDSRTQQAYLERSITVGEQSGDLFGLARALSALASFHIDRGDLVSARPWVERSLSLSRELGDQVRVAYRLCDLAIFSLREGDLETAARLCEQGLAAARETEDKFAHARAMQNAACVALARGDTPALRSLYEDLLVVAPRIPYPLWVSEHLSADLKAFADHLLREQGDDSAAGARFEDAVPPIRW